MLNQSDYEVGWDESNDSTGHVHDWNGAEAHLQDFLQALDLTYTLDDFNLLRVSLKHILHPNIHVCLRHVIPQQWHLLRPDGVVVQTTIAGLGDAK